MDLRLAHLELVLKNDGLRAAAQYLNSRVPYRFTTVYRLYNESFRVIEAIDKLDDRRLDPPPPTAFSDSLCRFPVLHGTFTTSHTAADPRLKGHIYPNEVGSYTGLQLIEANGDILGTFCHYDFAPQWISHVEYEFLQLAVKFISRHLQGNPHLVSEAFDMHGDYAKVAGRTADISA